MNQLQIEHKDAGNGSVITSSVSLLSLFNPGVSTQSQIKFILTLILLILHCSYSSILVVAVKGFFFQSFQSVVKCKSQNLLRNDGFLKFIPCFYQMK